MEQTRDHTTSSHAEDQHDDERPEGAVVSLDAFRRRRRRPERTVWHGCWLPCRGDFCLALELGVRRAPAEVIELADRTRAAG